VIRPQIPEINLDSEVNKDPQTYVLIGAAMEVHRRPAGGIPFPGGSASSADELKETNLTGVQLG